MYKPPKMTKEIAERRARKYILATIGYTAQELQDMADIQVENAAEILLSVELITQEIANLYPSARSR